MKTLYFSYVVTLFSLFTCGQNTNEKNISPSTRIPQGYHVYDKFSGDLNHDGIKDSVLVVKANDSSKIVKNRFGKLMDRNRRGILIFLREHNRWNLVLQNLSCFASENEDGGFYYPPQLSLAINSNELKIEYEHGRYGDWEYIFRFENSDFELIGYLSTSRQGPVILRETNMNFLTKKKLIKQNTNEEDEGGDEIFKETWSDFEIENPIKLSTITDFYELEIHNL